MPLVFFIPPENMEKSKVSGSVEKDIKYGIKYVNWEIYTRLLLFD